MGRGIVDNDRGSLIKAISTVRRNIGPLRGILMFSILLTLYGHDQPLSATPRRNHAIQPPPSRMRRAKINRGHDGRQRACRGGRG
jgi:hypothetical protein